ncbi:MAG: TIGR03905 family TSCPD domain-containing protein [Bacteroides sp.]|nr:TIGR03905 family TSCPD domain-containing protein [Bacteroides sp.]
MVKKLTYKTQGTCSSHIELEVEDGVISEVFFWGGCNGNLQGIRALVKGMKIDDVIRKLEGIRCGNRPTSCPDQLCKALRQIQEA